MKRRRIIFSLSALVSILAILFVAVLYFVFKQNIIIPGIITGVFVISIIVLCVNIDSMRHEASEQVEKNLDNTIRKTIEESNIGIIKYNEEYEIIWMSSFFKKRNMNHIDEKVLNWLPELQDLLEGNGESKTIIINDDKYFVSKIDQEQILTFKDITNEYDLDSKLKQDAYVLGLIGFDNYDEINLSEDELSFINSNIKTTILDYFKNFNVVYKTLRSNKILLLLNESNFAKIMSDRFSVLSKVRDLSKEGNVDFSISMAFARGSDDYSLLDESAQSLLELAQTRGGDQVVVRKLGEDVMYFGGTSEAREKLSKTKVRFTVNTLKDLITKSSNVIIVGHKDMDADCLGAALALSSLTKSLDIDCYIVTKTGGIEPMISDVLNAYKDVIGNKHNLISEDEALNLVDDNTLIFMVDHNLMAQANAPRLLEKGKRIVIIDHHRRKAELDVKPLMVYIEPAASSSCEIVCEFLPYLFKELDISKQEANIMYLGLLVDTDKYRVRTTSRTFDVAKQIRLYGADPLECDELMQEPYQNILDRSSIINAGKLYRNNIIISALDDKEYNRTIASQAGDTLVKSKGIGGAFVICRTSKDEVVVCARSNGEINVQVILEKMNGGGHMMAAGLQRSNTTVKAVQDELISVLDEYFKGEEDESNTNN